jgi:pimeloyl-ACP methyl ester carboxylesterase
MAAEGEVRYVEANGLRFAYLEAGEGPLLLLLHGFPDTAHGWAPVVPRLVGKGFRVVAPFMRGYHPTGAPPEDASMETIARDVLALIEALGATSAPDAASAVVVGHDWGAIAAYGAATLSVERVSKLFALAVPHVATWKFSPRKLWSVRHFIEYKLPGAAARFASDDFGALPALYRRWSPTWSPPPEEFASIRTCFANRASLDAAFGYYRKLGFGPPAFVRVPIRVPTVVFAGHDDPMAQISDYERARPMFEGGYVVEEVPGGHFMHREHPDAFAERLLAHL